MCRPGAPGRSKGPTKTGDDVTRALCVDFVKQTPSRGEGCGAEKWREVND